MNRLVAIAIAGLSFAACAPATTVEQTWTSPMARSQPPLRRVATVFFSDNVTLRRAGEDELARDLIARGVEATPSYAILRENELPDRDAVRAKLLSLGYDGIVTMRVVDRYQELQFMPGTYDGYWGYAYPDFYSPGYAYTEPVVQVETTAYSLRTNQLVWSALTKTVGDQAGKMIGETSRVVASQLTKRGLAT